MQLDKRLKRLRHGQGLSQEQLAERMQISRQAIAKWESGAAVPELDKLVALAKVFQTTLDALVQGEDACAKVSQPAEQPKHPYDAWIEFLLRAGAATYAGKGAPEERSTRPGSHDLRYAQGDMLYIDTYLGGQCFVGEEAIFRREEPLWSMNYSGRTLGEGFSGDFLKAALLKRPKDMPFRGPQIFIDGRYAYHNHVQGDFTWFQGREEIFADGQRVYECVYHGGIIRA